MRSINFCKAPRKKSSSERPASIATIRIDRISAETESEDIILLNVSSAAFSSARSCDSISVKPTGRCRFSFHEIMQFRTGNAASSDRIARMSNLGLGVDSISRNLAGSRVITIAVAIAGIMNTNKSCSTMEMRIAAYEFVM